MGSSSKRIGRISSELKKTVSKIIINDLDIPELKLATITKVKISPDLSVATIYFSTIIKSEDEISNAEKLFKRNNKTIRMYLSKYMNMRSVPQLRFFYDNTLDSVFKIEQLLNSIKKDENDSK